MAKKPQFTQINATAPEPTQFDKDLQARIDKAKEAIVVQTTAPEGVVPVEPEVAAPPAEAPAMGELTDDSPAPEPPAEPAVEAAPAAAPAVEETPVAPVAEAKPEAPPKPKEENFDWKAWRETQKENRRLKRELEAMRNGEKPKPAEAKPAEAPVIADNEDPFGTQAATRTANDALAEARRVGQNTEQQLQAMELNRQVEVFTAKTPDYLDALNYLADGERLRFWKTGAIVKAEEYLNNPADRAKVHEIADANVAVDDPKAPMGFRVVAMHEAPPNARELTDFEAARAIATEVWVATQANMIIEGARRDKRPVPEVVYELAGDAGYKSRAIAAATAQAPAAAPAQTPAERIRAQAKVSAAAKTLSATSAQATEMPAPTIRTLADLMAFRTRDPQGARDYMAKMEKQYGDKWHRNLGT